jgi:hypothetical protein
MFCIQGLMYVLEHPDERQRKAFRKRNLSERGGRSGGDVGESSLGPVAKMLPRSKITLWMRVTDLPAREPATVRTSEFVSPEFRL